MGKSSKSKKLLENIGHGKVTPVQIAFIVDRYLSDNSYSQTRAAFRSEASTLIAKSPAQEAPRGLLSLGAILNEYINLKEQKVMMDQEKMRLEQEKWRIQNLLQGLQDVMNVYNAGGGSGAPTSAAVQAPTAYNGVRNQNATGASPSGCPAYISPSVSLPPSMPPSARSMMDQPSVGKRKGRSAATEISSVAKKKCLSSTSGLPNGRSNIQEDANCSTAKQSSTQKSVANVSLVQGSSVAKRLFNQPGLSTPTKSPSPQTPPQAAASRGDQSISSTGVSSTVECCDHNTPEDITPTHCIVSYEKITVSPYKKMASYTIERGHCISTSPAKMNLKRYSTRDHVKGRLDFDGSDVPVGIDTENTDNSSTSESDKDIDLFDIDFPNLDAFGPNFSFSELLVDLELDGSCIDHTSPQAMNTSAETDSGTPPQMINNDLGPDKFLSEFTPAAEVLSEDMNIQGLSNVTTVNSATEVHQNIEPSTET